MACASADIGMRGDARAPAPVSYENLQAYAKNRLDAAVEYPKKRLLRRDLRLARLNMTIWFSSEMLAELCERTLVERKQGDPSAVSMEVYAIDARSGGWEPPALWREHAPFSSRDFDRVLDEGN